MNKTIAKLGRRLRLGVIGGGRHSFIGPVHRARRAWTTTTRSSPRCSPRNPTGRRRRAAPSGIAEDRAYGTAEEMFAGEKARADGMDVVAIMTPNDSHHDLCGAAIAARRRHHLRQAAHHQSRRRPRPRRSASRAFRPRLLPDLQLHRLPARPPGDARWSATATSARCGWCEAEYIQGYNAVLTAASSASARPSWRFCPRRSGKSLILGDIGSHAHHLINATSPGQNFARRHGGRRATGAGTEPARRRLCRRPLPARQQRAGHDVGDAGRGRRRAWTLFPGLRREGRPRMVREAPNQLFHSAPALPALDL